MKNGAKEFISADLAIIFRVLRDTFGMKHNKIAVEAVYEVLNEISENKGINTLSYVLITTAPGKINQVLEEMKKLPIIREAHAVTGVYDIIAALKTQDIKELKEVITTDIHKLSNISSTVTSLVTA